MKDDIIINQLMKLTLVFSPSSVQERDSNRFKTTFKPIQVSSVNFIPSTCLHLEVHVIIIFGSTSTIYFKARINLSWRRDGVLVYVRFCIVVGIGNDIPFFIVFWSPPQEPIESVMLSIR